MLLDDEGGRAVIVQPAEPCGEQVVQRRLADADRRVRPDGRRTARRRARRPARPPARCASPAASALAASGPERPLVDVDGPHRRARRPGGQVERDRPVAAAEVEQVAGRRGRQAPRAAGPWCPGRAAPPRTRPGRSAGSATGPAGRGGRWDGTSARAVPGVPVGRSSAVGGAARPDPDPDGVGSLVRYGSLLHPPGR